ncbi:MAG: hypothetical protein ACREXR_20880 [Gammaproteobacteria bacterium]
MAITKPSAWSAGRLPALLLPAVLILALVAVTLRAQPSAAAGNPDFAHALQVVKSDLVLKLWAADGSLLSGDWPRPADLGVAAA